MHCFCRELTLVPQGVTARDHCAALAGIGLAEIRARWAAARCEPDWILPALTW